MPQSVFLSYRRLDSQYATFAIADRLRWAFGANEVFFDRGSIRAGNEWPESLKRGLEAAKVLVIVMGKTWLTTADEWGRRRIDDERDWVRHELCTGLAGYAERRIHIIPLLLSGATRLRAEALDPPLRKLAEIEPEHLTDDCWEAGMESLIAKIALDTELPRRATEHSRNPNGSPARPPKNHSNQVALSDSEVRSRLEPLGRWQLQWGVHPWGIGGQAQEITRSYDFDSFMHAIDFMSWASTSIDKWSLPHHPRWENQWKVVTVWFTTWDVNCRVTKLDIEAADRLDKLYRAWTLDRL